MRISDWSSDVCSSDLIELDHRRQPILRLERLAHPGIGRTHSRAEDRPVVVLAQSEQIVEIGRHMRAVEITQADMKDSWRQARAIIAGLKDAHLTPSNCRRRRHRSGPRYNPPPRLPERWPCRSGDRKSTRMNSSH